jgi:hypothetical protein
MDNRLEFELEKGVLLTYNKKSADDDFTIQDMVNVAKGYFLATHEFDNFPFGKKEFKIGDMPLVYVGQQEADGFIVFENQIMDYIKKQILDNSENKGFGELELSFGEVTLFYKRETSLDEVTKEIIGNCLKEHFKDEILDDYFKSKPVIDTEKSLNRMIIREESKIEKLEKQNALLIEILSKVAK